MYKNFTISIFLLLFATSSFSQSNFIKGLIITNTNETVMGYVDFRTDIANSKLCKFKTSLNDSVQKFIPGQIRAFRFIDSGKYYVSKNLTINGKDYDFFLEFLVQGIINLYFTPLENDYYFFEKQDGSMTSITKIDNARNNPDPLKDHIDFKENTYDGYGPDMSYRFNLAIIFNDYKPLAKQINSADFNRKSMIEITMKYHEKMCKDGSASILFEDKHKVKNTKFSGLIYSGLDYSTLNVNMNKIPSMDMFSTIVGFKFGVSRPRYFKPLWLEIDINFSKFTGSCDYLTNKDLESNQYQVSGTKLNYNFGLKYLFELKKINLYIAGGVGKTIFSELKSSHKSTYTDSSNKVITSSADNRYLPETENYTTKFGIGVEKKINENIIIVIGLSANASVSRNWNKTLTTKEFVLGCRF